MHVHASIGIEIRRMDGGESVQCQAGIVRWNLERAGELCGGDPAGRRGLEELLLERTQGLGPVREDELGDWEEPVLEWFPPRP